MKIMTKEDKEQLNIEISHIFESGANHLRIFDMVENFIDKRYKAINYTHCSTQLKDKEEQTFSEWIEDNGYYLKDGNWFNRNGYSRNIDKLKKYHELND